MRWRNKQKQSIIPTNRENLRTKKRFLFFPRCIDFETRWLETAEWEERLYVYQDLSGFGCVLIGGNSKDTWNPTRWIDTKDNQYENGL